MKRSSGALGLYYFLLDLPMPFAGDLDAIWAVDTSKFPAKPAHLHLHLSFVIVLGKASSKYSRAGGVVDRAWRSRLVLFYFVLFLGLHASIIAMLTQNIYTVLAHP
jgi:hypothetical protein